MAQQAENFLQQQLRTELPLVDLHSLIYGASLLEIATGKNPFVIAPKQWKTSVTQSLESLRREDGGYAKSPDGKSSSTYYSFLTLLTHQLLEQKIIAPERLSQFIFSQQREDGGFVEIAQMQQSGTNPTAAAIGTLRILDEQNTAPNNKSNSLLTKSYNRVIPFLCKMQTDEGGFKANSRIPIADLMSTFTALLTLQDLEEKRSTFTTSHTSAAYDLESLKRYVRSLASEKNNGGFLAAHWDDTLDVEYSFYGIAATSLC